MFLRRVVPTTSFVATVGTSLVAGRSLMGAGGNDSLWSLGWGIPYAACVLLAVGAHAFGHYIAARRSGVDAYPPYFVPALSAFGIAGAYVKLGWPVAGRRAMCRIFAAGPIAGFALSAALLLLGTALSEDAPRQSVAGLRLGDSLLTLGVERLLFPHMPESNEVVLHPVGLAGYLGLFFNLWHLFPAGRLDGGRVVYALWGYRPSLAVSWITIVALALIGMIWPGWWIMSIFAALTMIRLRRQHPIDRLEGRLDPATVGSVWLMLVVLVITFVPVPVKVSP